MKSKKSGPVLLESAILVCWLATALCGATRYVSTAGSDGNSGESETAPWQTLGHAADNAVSGDVLLLRRGDVFREAVQFGSGLTIDAYGAGTELPAVSGSEVIDGWQVHEGNIYVADAAQAVEYLYVEGRLMHIARYPNTGWLRKDGGSENGDGSGTVLMCAGLQSHPRRASGYWAGANIRWRRWSWWYETRTIGQDDGNGTLSLEGASSISIQPDAAGWGFYLDNRLAELDTAGEWYFDPDAMKIYLWAPGGGDPGGMRVEGTVRDAGISLSGSDISNIAIRHQKDVGMSITGKCAVRSCVFEGIGGEGGGTALQGSWNVQEALVSGNLFRDNLNTAVSWNENGGRASASIFEENVLINTGMVPGYGGSGSWHAAGMIVINGDGLQIRYNEWDHTGYAGIILGCEGVRVEYNIIRSAMSTLNDGGGIYLNTSRCILRNNIVLASEGDLESSGPWANLGQGIWPEFLEDFGGHLIENNTVAWCGAFGLFITNNFRDTIRGNVVFGNARAQLMLSGRETNGSTGRTENLPQAHLIDGNVFCSGGPGQPAMAFQFQYDYGVMADNYFLSPWEETAVESWEQEWGPGSGGPLTLDEWRQQFPAWSDPSAVGDAAKVPGNGAADAAGTPRLVINETRQEKSFDAGTGQFNDIDGNPVTGSFTLDPYTSRVLIRAAAGGDLEVRKPVESGTAHLTRGPQGQLYLRLELEKAAPVRAALYSLSGRRLFLAIP